MSNLSEDVLNWYRTAPPVDCEIPLYGNPLRFYPPSQVDTMQQYYREPDYPSPATRQPGDWLDYWIVIGDIGADPIITFAKVETTPILFAYHGEGAWRPVELAPNLTSLLAFLTYWIDNVVPNLDTYISYDGVTPELQRLLRDNCTSILGQTYVEPIIQTWFPM